jgi:RHS repeat-associated protein
LANLIAKTIRDGRKFGTYGYTAEYQGGYNDLVYLRARQYSPSMGRFLTRDTWGGDENQPMSYNAWLYGYANPINNMDPTGNSPIFNGYAEGWSTMTTFLLMVWEIRGEEIVYDFATLERAKFSYHGVGKVDENEKTASGACLNLMGWSVSPYVTGLSGFDKSDGLQTDYQGDSVTGFVSGDIPFLLVAGFTGSIGVSSSTAWPGTWLPNFDVVGTSLSIGIMAGNSLDLLIASVGAYHSVYTIESTGNKITGTRTG